MYFNYHSRLKQLLKTEKYVVIKENGNPFTYRFIFPKLIKSYPIREYREIEYINYINEPINYKDFTISKNEKEYIISFNNEIIDYCNKTENIVDYIESRKIQFEKIKNIIGGK